MRAAQALDLLTRRFNVGPVDRVRRQRLSVPVAAATIAAAPLSPPGRAADPREAGNRRAATARPGADSRDAPRGVSSGAAVAPERARRSRAWPPAGEPDTARERYGGRAPRPRPGAGERIDSGGRGVLPEPPRRRGEGGRGTGSLGSRRLAADLRRARPGPSPGASSWRG